MKILLINPPATSHVDSILGISAPPLGLAYLASMVEERHEVEILDCPTMKYDFDAVKYHLQKVKPELVGVTSTTSTIYQAYRVISLAKCIDPQITTVLGGPHVSFMAYEVLDECKDLDVVICGEGETSFKRLVEDWPNLSRVPNAVYRQGDDVRENPEKGFIEDLDKLPFLAYHLLPMNSYRHEGERFGAVMTSRGCPYNWIFCSSSLLWGKKWRARTPKNVIQELELLSHQYGINEIEFLDDLFTLDQKRAERICDLIRERDLEISYVCSSRANTFSESLGKKLMASGCHTIYFGAESAAQHALNFLNKGISSSQTRKAVEMAKKIGLKTIVSFILGTPGETEQDIKKTIEFSKELKPNYAQFTIYTLFPGIRAFELAEKEDIILTKDWSKYTTQQSIIKLKHISLKRLNTLLRRAYLEFYLNPHFIFHAVIDVELMILFRSLSRGFIWIFQNNCISNFVTKNNSLSRV